mgnify:CR=1 FL=1
MKDKTTSSNSLQAKTSAISQLVGASPVLPGESESIYQQGLVATVIELGAQTPLQIYLAEKSTNAFGGCVVTKTKNVPPSFATWRAH